MLFSELMASAGLSARLSGGDVEVSDVQIDSRRCNRGSCFVAVRGWKDDGHKYIAEAIEAGASAVVCQDAAFVPNGAACAALDETRSAAGRIAQAMYGWPSRKLPTLGITGTNGKTTVAYMIRSILRAAGHDPALLGTIAYETGRQNLPAVTTTPDPIRLAEMTAEMVAAGKTHLVMEVSSHALEQRRTAGLDFCVGVYTNLSGDHLDYHGDMDSYLSAKLLLFEGLSSQAVAVLNRDDAHGEAFAAATTAKVRWYGLGPRADVRAGVERSDTAGSRFVLSCAEGQVTVETPMIGRYNVQNCLAAAAACMALNVELQIIAEALGKLRCVPGRLERVRTDGPYQVFVDYAHTDDALRNVLGSLRSVVEGRIILVFGCGGDRDRTKRPRMAKAAEELADRIVITSDNPRSEDPDAIIKDIVAGLGPEGMAKAGIEPDRRAAIALAVAAAEAGDVVLIAGKGHESYQIIGQERFDFDDVKVAEQVICRREGVA